jgi:hypothetical protein
MSMYKSSSITIGSVILALTEAKAGGVSVRTAKQILAEIVQVFPGCETSEKSIYSTVCRANISMPGSNRSVYDAKAYELLMKKLEKKEVKTGTDK